MELENKNDLFQRWEEKKKKMNKEQMANIANNYRDDRLTSNILIIH